MPLKQLDHYKVNLHILSPIHIGTGEELDPFSFIIRDNQLCLIDLGRWMEEYPEKGNLYTVIDSGDFAQLRTFIADSFNLETAINHLIPIDSSKLLETYQRAIREKDPRNQVLVTPMTRNEVTMAAYIPGSSIKGAIRTAIANQFVQAAGVTSKDAARAKYNEKIFGRIKSDPLSGLALKDVSLEEFGTVIVEAREYSMNPYKGITPKGHVEVAKSLCQTGQPVVYPLHFSMAAFEIHGTTIDIKNLVNSLYQFYVPKYDREYRKFYQSEKAREIQTAIMPMNKAIAAMKTNETLIRIGHFSHVECVTLDKVRNPRTRKGKNGTPLPWGTTRTLANGIFPFGWAKLEFCDLDSKPRSTSEWSFTKSGKEMPGRESHQSKSQEVEHGKKPASKESLESLKKKWKK